MYEMLQKTLQYCKVISLQLIKINERKKIKNKNVHFFWKYIWEYFFVIYHLLFTFLFSIVIKIVKILLEHLCAKDSSLHVFYKILYIVL